MRWTVSHLAMVAVLTPVSFSGAGATPFDNYPKLLLHVTSTTSKGACGSTGHGALTNCQTAVVQAGLSTSQGPFHFVYLLAARGRLQGISGLQCGIVYQGNARGAMDDGIGVDVFGWTLCAALEFPTPGPSAWPRSGGGTIITWDRESNCQERETAVAGYFYLAAYSHDYMTLTGRPVDGQAKVADCDAKEWGMGQGLGVVAFSNDGSDGCNPCLTSCHPVSPPPPNYPPSLLFHVAPANGPTGCNQVPDLCSQAVSGALSSSAGLSYYTYLIGDRGLGQALRSIQCGITYGGGRGDAMADGRGIDILSWHSCASTEVPGAEPAWPRPESGNLFTWNTPDCESLRPVVAGYFYLTAFSPDTLRVIPHPEAGVASVVPCYGSTTNLAGKRLGYAVFSDHKLIGCNPCYDDCPSVTPVSVTTWGAIKALWRGR